MKFIAIDNKNGRHGAFNANAFMLGVALAGFLSIPLLAGYVAYRFGVGDARLNGAAVAGWRDALDEQQASIAATRQDVEQRLNASTLRIARLQARVMRLDALGERMVRMGRLDEGEFDFSLFPAMGGPESAMDVAAYRPPAYMDVLDQLTRNVADREKQLNVLETLLAKQKVQRDVFLAGRPIRKGWISSGFGHRVDPITGQQAWHNGVDFAGRGGADVTALAAGLVVFAGERSGYGWLVEINHGGGYSTRYGHHKELVVKAGDIVHRGELIGLMGNTGRSTGPHVHFEVFKNGRIVDPSTYIHRAVGE